MGLEMREDADIRTR